MKLPNLLIPGTQKGGTTTLHRMLSKHPSIFMSANKEPGLFHNRRNATEEDLRAYAKHFEQAPESVTYIGEATAHYFWEKSDKSVFSRRDWRSHTNTHLIREMLPSNLSVILTLRHPVDRAISGYNHHATRGRISGNETIMDAAKRPELGIVDLGFYTRHYAGWSKGLPDARFFLTTTDELNESTATVFEKLIKWLQLPYHQIPENVLNTRWNSAEIMKKNSGTKPNPTPDITNDHINELFEIYRDEILHWKKILPGAKNWRESA